MYYCYGMRQVSFQFTTCLWTSEYYFYYHFSNAIHCNSGQIQFAKRIAVILALVIKNYEVSVLSVISGVKTSHSNVMLEIRPQS